MLPAELRKQHIVRCRVDTPTLEWLEDVAKRHQTDTSDMARRLILRGLAEQGNPPGGEFVEFTLDLPE